MATAMTATRSPLSSTVQRSSELLIAPRSEVSFAPPNGTKADHRGLSHWMNRVLEELADFQEGPDPETVHDLRVAIRRCRSLATVMEEVDPDPTWHDMRKTARKLFRGLGAVRDAQVLEDWIKHLAPEDDSLRAKLVASLKADEKQRTEDAAHVAGKFDKKEWAELERLLRRRVHMVPAGGLAAECLALERLEETKELHNRALRSEKPKPWHELRIGLKKFRYTLEGLLPEHSAAWGANLKRLQDLLGDVHDLDVLSELVREHESAESSASTNSWQEKIASERGDRIETYRQLTLGKTSLLHEWRQNLPQGKRLEAATMARLRATARAADSHTHKSAQVSRIALRVFEVLRRAATAPVLHEPTLRHLLQAAAKLHGIDSAHGRRLSQKAARKFLLSLTVPPNWTAEQWDVMAWSVRFHRGPEPKQKNGFAKLPEDQQTQVRAIAGVLRLARALRKSGVETPVGLRAESSAEAILLTVPALPDTAEIAARLAAAKHLLESVLEKPLILKSMPKPEKPSAPIEEPSPAPQVAEGSLPASA